MANSTLGLLGGLLGGLGVGGLASGNNQGIASALMGLGPGSMFAGGGQQGGGISSMLSPLLNPMLFQSAQHNNPFLNPLFIQGVGGMMPMGLLQLLQQNGYQQRSPVNTGGQ